MRMPPLPITLAFIAVAWCVGGLWQHGWKTLLYPAVWLIVAVLFLVLNKVLAPSPISAPSGNVSDPQ